MILTLRGISLFCFVIYSLIVQPLTDPVLMGMWLLSIIATGLLAHHLNRTVAGWVLGAIVIPFWIAAFLALSSRRPENALTAIDNSWLNMERPTNKMVVTGILFFDSPLDKSALETTLQNGLLKFDRFKQRVVTENRYNCWQDDPHFALQNHLSFHQLPEGSSAEDFHQQVNHLAEKSLEMNKPLWHMDVFHGVNGGSALVVRIHHCIADGIALVRVLLSMTKPVNGKEATLESAKTTRKESPLTHLLHSAVGLFAAFPHAFKLPDSHSQLKNPLSGRRATAWSKTMPLEKIRAISKAHQAKINDLVLSATAGALRNYLVDTGADPNHMTLRVLVPINLKPMDGEIELGNQVGFVYLPLPIHEDSPLKRLAAVKQSMDTVKGGQEAMLSLLFLRLIGALPPQLQTWFIDTFNKNASSTMTNVPGPREPLLFAETEIKNLIFFGPQSGTMGVGISVLSYAGQMTMGVNADANLVPDPEKLVALFLSEIENWPEAV